MSTSIARLVVEMAESGAGSLIGTIGRIGAAVGVAGVALGGMGIAAAAANEQADISFTTMLGSAEKAQGFLTDMRDFAAKTPFEFPELQTAASSLISVGVEASDVIPIMTTLGNVTSGMGTGSEGVRRATIALQQMSAAGRITAEDLNQLRDAGIPVFDLLAGATGKTKAEIAAMAQTGKLGKAELDAMFEALKNGGPGLERFSGLMEKQSMSLKGMIATFKDTLGQGLSAAMQPAVGVIKASLGPVTETVGSVLNSLSGPLQQAFTGLAPAIGPLVQVLGALMSAVLPIVGVLGEVLGGVLTEVAALFSSMGPDISNISGLFGTLLRSVAPVIPEVLNLVMALLPMGIALGGVIAQALAAVAPLIVTVASQLAVGLKPVIDAMVPVLHQVGLAFGQLLIALLPLLPPLVELLLAFLPLVPAILSILPPVLELVTLLVDLLAPALTAVVGVIANVVTPIINFLVNLLSNPARAVEQMAAAWDAAWAWVKNIIGSAGQWIGDRVDDLVGFVRSIPGRVVDAIGDLGRLLWNAGVKLIAGLLGGIKDKAEDLFGFVGGIASKIASLKGPLDKDAVLLVPAGEAIMAGLVHGLQAEEGRLVAQLARTTGLIEGVGGGASIGLAPGSAGGGFGAVPVVNVHIEVHGSVLTEADLMHKVKEGIARDSRLAGGVTNLFS